MRNKTFSAGVILGGLNDIQDIKILICYVMDYFSKDFSKFEISNILQNYGLANYFDVNEAFEILVKAGNIIRNTEEKYVLSSEGKMIVDELSKNLPLTVKEKAVSSAKEYFNRVKSEKENKVIIRKVETGYEVTCYVLDGKFEMMKLKLYAPDINEAGAIKNNFYKNPSEIYHTVLMMLTSMN